MTDPARQFPLGPIPEPDRTLTGLQATRTRLAQATAEWHTLLAGRPAADLARTYRPGGWTVHQLAHHVADAHLHGLNRLHYGLTTPDYVIQPFDQDAWLTLPDAALPVADALALLDAVNGRWLALLAGVDPAHLTRRVLHPAEGEQDLWRLTAKHDWHLRHHLAHARLALESA
ncbi:DinB family protein [Deinococcus aquaedulcis]|uniref:DinB family protein n=1 Tax=Deinococcus aquaedulcis TaxID=2840455 RepID=UPI001C83B0BF|nr:DinB family protein [Deinococcus aquaedulcis]